MENTFFEAPEYPVLDRFKRSIVLFLRYAITLLTTLIFIRLLEYTYIAIKAQLPSGILLLSLQSLFFDIIFLLKSLPVLYLPFVLFFFSLKVKKHLYISTGIIFSIYILIYLLLLKYFFTALVPLGSDFYSYSYSDVKQTVSASLSIDFLTIVLFILPFVLLWFTLSYVELFSFVKYKVAVGVLVGSLLLLYFNVSALPAAGNFKTAYAYNIAINKQAFFLETSYTYFFDNEPDIDIYASNYFEDGTDADNSLRPQLKCRCFLSIFERRKYGRCTWQFF